MGDLSPTRPIWRVSPFREFGSGEDGGMPDALTVRLPPADPAVYLEWMAYWRDIERKMLERPALHAFASEESVPFIRDPVADFISDVMAGGVIRQAGAARRMGAESVAPEIVGDALVLRDAMKYIAARLEWLGGPGMHEALRIEPPSPDVVALREWALDSITVQLAIHFSAPEPIRIPDLIAVR
jgi:hypothetical protein